MAKRKYKKRIQTNDRWASESPIIRKVYRSIDEVREAWNTYLAIPDHSDRRIYYVTFEHEGAQVQLYFIGKSKIEVYETLCLHYFSLHVQPLNTIDGGDPRPRLEYEISMLHVQIEEAKSFLSMMDSMPSTDARYQELRAQSQIRLTKKEAVLSEKIKHLMHLKELTKEQAIEEHRKRKPISVPTEEPPRIFVAPERPPTI